MIHLGYSQIDLTFNAKVKGGLFMAFSHLLYSTLFPVKMCNFLVCFLRINYNL